MIEVSLKAQIEGFMEKNPEADQPMLVRNFPEEDYSYLAKTASEWRKENQGKNDKGKSKSEVKKEIVSSKYSGQDQFINPIIENLEFGDVKSLLWEKMKYASPDKIPQMMEIWEKLHEDESSSNISRIDELERKQELYYKFFERDSDEFYQFQGSILEEEGIFMPKYEKGFLDREIRTHDFYSNTTILYDRFTEEEYEKVRLIDRFVDKGLSVEEIKEIVESWDYSSEELDNIFEYKPKRDLRKKLSDELVNQLHERCNNDPNTKWISDYPEFKTGHEEIEIILKEQFP